MNHPGNRHGPPFPQGIGITIAIIIQFPPLGDTLEMNRIGNAARSHQGQIIRGDAERISFRNL